MLWLGLRMSVHFRAAALLCAVVLRPGAVCGQDTEQATRQFAVAVGFQNQKLYDSAIDEWNTFLTRFPGDSRLDKATHYLGTCQLQAKRFPQAVVSFELVLKKYPQFELMDQTILNVGTAHFSLAQESKKSEDYGRAEMYFTRLSNEFPKSEFAGRAFFYRGESLYHQNKFQDAADAYKELSRTFPKDEFLPDAMYALGICQESLKQTSDAQATFDAFQKKFPKHALLTEVRMRQGECLFAEQKFAEAQKQFELASAVKEFALADTAMLRQARCLYELRKFDEAGAVYWNVPRQFPKTKHYDTSLLAGAKCYYLIGKYTLARQGLENVAKRNGSEAAEASQWIARSLLKEKKPAEALAVLDAAVAKHASSPAFSQLVLARIDALYELPGRRAETIPLYADFAQKYPTDELAAQARYMSALTALDLGDHAAAKANADVFIQQYPGDKLLPDVQFIAAESRLLLKEYKDAERFYREFLKTPEHASSSLARVRLVLAIQLAGRHEDALKEIEATLNDLKDPTLKSEALSIRGRSLVAAERLEQAAESFEMSLKMQPDRDQSDQSLLNLADVYRRLNRVQDSASQLSRINDRFPKSVLREEATFRLGELAYSQNEFDQAIAQYTAVMRNWPTSTFSPHAQYGLGWCLFKKGDFSNCVKAVKELRQKHGQSEVAAKAAYVQAMAEFQLQQYPAAELSVKSFLAAKPTPNDGLDAQYLLGLVLAAQQKFKDASVAYAAILTTDSKYADADKVLYELGWAYSEQGQQNESIAAFQRLGKEYPNSPLAVESLFRVGESYYDAGQYSEAVKAYSETYAKAGAAELGEKAAHKLAWSHFKADRVPDAAAAFAAQLKSFPAGALAGDAQFLLGECQYKQKHWSDALQQYKLVIAAQHPTYQSLAIYRSGECEAAQEQWENSRKFHQQVLDGFPEFELKPEARYGVAWALQQQEKFAEAVSSYEQVTEETDTETAAKARFMIGECYFAQKNHKEATRHFLKAAFAYGHPEWSAMAWFEAARCFEVLKDIEQARNCYQQMINKFPEHSKTADARKRLAEL